MKSAFFLFSRTKTQDYSYMIPLPSECSEEVSSFLQGQLARMQTGKPDGTVHFFLTNTDAVLVRAINSGAHDAYSRPILSLEGFYCPSEEIRTLWLCLPLIIPGFYTSPSLYSSVVQDGEIHTVSVSRLLDACMSRSQKAVDVKAVTKAMYDAKAPASFTYDANGLHLSAETNPARRSTWIPKETRSCTLTLTFHKKEKTAQLEAVCADSPVYTVLRSAPVFAENGWHFGALEASAEALEQELLLRGWTLPDAQSKEGGDA